MNTEDSSPRLTPDPSGYGLTSATPNSVASSDELVDKKMRRRLKRFVGGAWAWLGALAIYPVARWVLSEQRGNAYYPGHEDFDSERWMWTRIIWNFFFLLFCLVSFVCSVLGIRLYLKGTAEGKTFSSRALVLSVVGGLFCGITAMNVVSAIKSDLLVISTFP